MNYKVTSGAPGVIFLCHPERSEVSSEKIENEGIYKMPLWQNSLKKSLKI